METVHNNTKLLYEFDIKIEKEVEKTETIKEGDKEVITKTKVKELAPVFFAFKKPSRSERESCEEFRAAAWGKCIEKGIMPEAVLLKTYSNHGGILSEGQKKEYNDLLSTIETKTKEYNDAASEVKENILKEIINLREEVITFQRSQSGFFENTAEAKSRLKTIEYITLMFSYFREDAAKNWEPFFKGDTLEKKYNYLEKLEDDSNELFLKSTDKLTFISALWLHLGNNLKKEDIESFES
jgi:hypothetical protein